MLFSKTYPSFNVMHYLLLLIRSFQHQCHAVLEACFVSSPHLINSLFSVPDKCTVNAILHHKLTVSALLNYPAAIDDDHPVGVFNGFQPVRCHYDIITILYLCNS